MIECCTRCDKQDATIQFLNKRLENLEERIIHLDAFLSKLMEHRCHNCICSHCCQDEYANHEAAIYDIHNRSILSVLQSRKLVGTSHEGSKISKGHVKPRGIIAPQTDIRKFKTVTSEDGVDENVEKNDIQERMYQEDMNSNKIVDAPFVSYHDQKLKEMSNSKKGLSKKVKFVNSTATQVRYAHLESDNGLAPGFHAETRIIHDCYHTTPSSENDNGLAIPYRCKT